MLIFFIFSLLVVVVDSDLGSAADVENESVVADFTTSPQSGEAPLTVQFTDTSTGSPTSWLWDFGDGSTSNSQSPSHTYSNAGTYTVTLTVSDSWASDSVKGYITVKEKAIVPVVVASFSSNATSGKVPLTVKFTDNSSGGPTSWKWDFNGDGTIDSTVQNPVYTYSTAGTYSVTLNATNGTVSSELTKSSYIYTGNGPTASFTTSPQSGEAPLTVQFTDTSTGSPTSWLWDFGDGSTSNSQSPSHTYSRAGTYTVKLTVTNSYGSSGTASSSITAYSIAVPVAGFSSNATSGSAPLSVQFTDQSTNGPTAWKWDFNSDGTIDSTVQNPVYVYTAPGTYSVTLSVVNGTARDNVKKSNFITVGSSLLASFTISPQAGNAPLTVHFNDTSSGNVTSWAWDFGDGNTSASQNPSHIYFRAGSYAVKLTATNAFGSSTSALSFIKVLSITSPVPDFTSNVTSGQVPLTVQFQDLSTGGPTAWEWDFNSDGTIDSTVQNPVYRFMTSGFYTVTLRAGNGTAWSNITKSNYIMVGDGIHASFVTSTRTGNAPLTVQFNDTSSGNVTSWFWDFGDGKTSTIQNPSHGYSESGSYSVTLNVSNVYGYSAVTWADFIKVGEDEGGSGGSVSSGGTSPGAGGISPEPASNVEVKELAQEFITAGSHKRFEFVKNATSIMYVKFDSYRNFGETIAIVEQLKSRSVLTPIEPSGKVYTYLNIWVGNKDFATSGNIGNAIVGFRVKRSAISEYEAEKSSVFMYRYSDGKWNALPTRKMGEDNHYMYFESRTPGFSSFSIITGKKAIEYQEKENESAEQPFELSINSRQVEMPGSGFMPATEHKDWSKVSKAIKVFVGFMVILLIAIAVTEKKR
ncbi:cell surface protein [Methanosarcina sp. WWM596]|nr:cell surface protein [Methanosarcina sp. WWM596]